MDEKELEILKLKAKAYDLSMRVNNLRVQAQQIEREIIKTNQEIERIEGEKDGDNNENAVA